MEPIREVTRKPVPIRAIERVGVWAREHTPRDALFEKTLSNMQEVAARGGKVLLISDDEGIRAVGDLAWKTIALPKVHPFVAPILYAIPIQLLAYHIAALKGTDVDQPRNLAKSVTVE